MPSGRRHYRVTLADALGAHQQALRLGGREGVLKVGLIESAIARPYSGYYRSMAGKAAALVQSMATNHGFADGNKPTSVLLVYLLLTKSGYGLVPLSDDEVESMVLGVISKEISFDDLVLWFKQRLERT